MQLMNAAESARQKTGRAGHCGEGRAFATLDNKNRYQGDYAEHEDEWDVHYDDFFLRTYDPQTGRFINIDPYDQFASGYVGMGWIL